MINTNLSNSYPMTRGLMATKQEVSVVRPSEESFIEFCRCLCACAIVFKVFADPGESEFKNDKSSFLQRRTIPTDTITFYLDKDGVQLATLNTNTYGTYYDFGSLDDAELKGYLLDWEAVYVAHGWGNYTVRAAVTVVGQAVTITSDQFLLLEYSDLRADGTIRIETWQNGQIMSGVDYTNLNWYQQYRIAGYFSKLTPTLEIDNYQNSSRDLTQIQDKIVNNYKLETELLPSSVMNAIIYDGLLANKIQITDYNLCVHERYQKLQLYPDSIEDFQSFRYNPNALAVFKFTDKRQNIIKRTFK